MPPSAAVDVARSVAIAMSAVGRRPAYADCNAISPATTSKIASEIGISGVPFIDAGIVGPPPGKSDQPTRFYVSGPQAELMGVLDGPEISVRQMGPEIGRASAIKMCYAAITKGSWTLYTAALTTAEVMGLTDLYLEELESSRPHVADEMLSLIHI